MSGLDVNAPVSRRRAFAIGGGLAGGALAASPLTEIASARGHHHRHHHLLRQHGRLPVEQIQDILQLEGTVSHGVLSVDVERKDIGDVQGPMGVTFTPAFEIHGTLTFQPLGGRRAFLNGDMALKTEETDEFIDALLDNGLVFQAFHQHYEGLEPQVWFEHFRGVGDALALARAIHNAIEVTSTPLPQTMPAHPRTPLDPERLARILHGEAEVGDEGVVTVTVSRTDKIDVDGVVASAEANISPNIEFKPLNAAGTLAAVAPDFSMTSAGVQTLISVMRRQGWDVGCLYNQETAEHPQLFFSHQLKTGNPYELAHEVRRGLNHLQVE
jgi:Domain of Unknown Function (DUF1259)